MTRNARRWVLIVLSSGLAIILVFILLKTASFVGAWAEEDTGQNAIEYFDPQDYPTPVAARTTYTPNVSSIHFDLVGALAIAAGFSVTDAATMQAYSQGTDSGNLPGANPVYTFTADPANYPPAPPITSVPTSALCPSPATTAPTVTLGATDIMTENGNTIEVFTSRFGPYGTFFHEPHNRADELGAIQDWATGQTDVLTAVVTFGYSSTAKYDWQGIANIYETTPCFVTDTARVDTGNITAGSVAAFGIYLHSLGDNWSHQECLSATEALGWPFAAHVQVDGQDDPFWPCRWTSHHQEFGKPDTFPESNRTFTGTVEVYKALYTYALQSERTLYRPISLTAEGGHILNTLYDFVHNTGSFSVPRPNQPTRRELADELRTWALQTRQDNPAYWKHQLYLPALMK